MSKASGAKVREGAKTEDESEKKLKPCCACPETKKARDEWWVTSHCTVLQCTGTGRTVVKGGSVDVATGKRRMLMRRRSAFYPSYSATPLDQ